MDELLRIIRRCNRKNHIHLFGAFQPGFVQLFTVCGKLLRKLKDSADPDETLKQPVAKRLDSPDASRKSIKSTGTLKQPVAKRLGSPFSSADTSRKSIKSTTKKSTGNGRYYVGQLLDKREADGGPEYLVKWRAKRYKGQDSWVPVENLLPGCVNMIEKFEKERTAMVDLEPTEEDLLSAAEQSKNLTKGKNSLQEIPQAKKDLREETLVDSEFAHSEQNKKNDISDDIPYNFFAFVTEDYKYKQPIGNPSSPRSSSPPGIECCPLESGTSASLISELSSDVSGESQRKSGNMTVPEGVIKLSKQPRGRPKTKTRISQTKTSRSSSAPLNDVQLRPLYCCRDCGLSTESRSFFIGHLYSSDHLVRGGGGRMRCSGCEFFSGNLHKIVAHVDKYNFHDPDKHAELYFDCVTID